MTPVENNPRRAFQMALDEVWEELTGAGGEGVLSYTPYDTPFDTNLTHHLTHL